MRMRKCWYDNAETVAKIRQLRSEGLTFKQIGKRLGYNEQTITDGLMIADGFEKSRYRNTPPEVIDQIRKFITEGKTRDQIRHSLNLTQRQLRCLLIWFNITECQPGQPRNLWAYDPVKREAVLKDIEDGLTSKEICLKHNIRPAKLCLGRNILESKGYKFIRRVLRPEQS